MNNTKIVLIHDDLLEIDPLIIVLKERFGPNNVILKKKSKEGLDYVLQNLTNKIIVILDLNFKSNEPSGVNVFEEIRKHTSLVYIIIWTASALEDINREDLKSMINNDALAIMSSTDDISKIIEKVNLASHQLDTRVDSALEHWITSHSESEQEVPYIISRNGTEYSLKQMLIEIRNKTEFGMETESNILQLAIDLLTRKKS